MNSKTITFKEGDKIIMLENCSGLIKGQICTLREMREGDLMANGCCDHYEYWKKLDNDTRFNDMKKKVEKIRNKYLNKDFDKKDFQVGDTIEVFDIGISFGSRIHLFERAKIIEVFDNFVIADFPISMKLYKNEIRLVKRRENE